MFSAHLRLPHSGGALRLLQYNNNHDDSNNISRGALPLLPQHGRPTQGDEVVFNIGHPSFVVLIEADHQSEDKKTE